MELYILKTYNVFTLQVCIFYYLYNQPIYIKNLFHQCKYFVFRPLQHHFHIFAIILA